MATFFEFSPVADWVPTQEQDWPNPAQHPEQAKYIIKANLFDEVHDIFNNNFQINTDKTLNMIATPVYDSFDVYSGVVDYDAPIPPRLLNPDDVDNPFSGNGHDAHAFSLSFMQYVDAEIYGICAFTYIMSRSPGSISVLQLVFEPDPETQLYPAYIELYGSITTSEGETQIVEDPASIPLNGEDISMMLLNSGEARIVVFLPRSTYFLTRYLFEQQFGATVVYDTKQAFVFVDGNYVWQGPFDVLSLYKTQKITSPLKIYDNATEQNVGLAVDENEPVLRSTTPTCFIDVSELIDSTPTFTYSLDGELQHSGIIGTGGSGSFTDSDNPNWAINYFSGGTLTIGVNEYSVIRNTSDTIYVVEDLSGLDGEAYTVVSTSSVYNYTWSYAPLYFKLTNTFYTTQLIINAGQMEGEGPTMMTDTTPVTMNMQMPPSEAGNINCLYLDDVVIGESGTMDIVVYLTNYNYDGPGGMKAILNSMIAPRTFNEIRDVFVLNETDNTYTWQGPFEMDVPDATSGIKADRLIMNLPSTIDGYATGKIEFFVYDNSGVPELRLRMNYGITEVVKKVTLTDI